MLIDLDQGKSVTNDAHNVVEDLNNLPDGINGRRVIYRDTIMNFSVINVNDGVFTGFSPFNISDLPCPNEYKDFICRDIDYSSAGLAMTRDQCVQIMSALDYLKVYHRSRKITAEAIQEYVKNQTVSCVAIKGILYTLTYKGVLLPSFQSICKKCGFTGQEAISAYELEEACPFCKSMTEKRMYFWFSDSRPDSF